MSWKCQWAWKTGLAVLLYATAVQAQALTYNVNRFDDPDPSGLSCPADCSLRVAMLTATGTDIIELDPGTYTLSLSGRGDDTGAIGDLDVLGIDVTVRPNPALATAANARTIVIDAKGLDRVFDVLSGNTLTLTNVKLINGDADTGNGGAILNNGTLTLDRAEIAGSKAADGAGIYNAGTLTIFDSTLTGNAASNSGGALYDASAATETITNSTFSGNTAAANGGAIYANTGVVNLVHVTLYANGAGTAGGGAINNAGATVNVSGTIIGSNTPENCVGTISTGGSNIETTDTCGLGATPSDYKDTDPSLAGLAYYGGPTQTHALVIGSLAIDKAGSCSGTDQRGVTRPKDGDSSATAECDIGAYEWNEAIELSVDNRHNDDCPDKYDNVQYTVTIKNSGSIDASQPSVSVTLPSTMTYVGNTASAGLNSCSLANQVLSCNLTNPYTAGSVDTLTITMNAPTSGVQQISAVLFALENDATPDDNSSVEFTTVNCADCFIATAAYGSPVAQELEGLRDFRDRYLLSNVPGRLFVDRYYRYSPNLADGISESDWLRDVARRALRPFVALSHWLKGEGDG